MRSLVFILCLLPSISFAQTKDYKTYDKAVQYNNEGNIGKAIKYANKALRNNSDWRKPNLLLASIYANNNQIELAVDYLLKVYDETSPEYLMGIEQIAKLYYRHGYYKKALYYFERNIINDNPTITYTVEHFYPASGGEQKTILIDTITTNKYANVEDIYDENMYVQILEVIPTAKQTILQTTNSKKRSKFIDNCQFAIQAIKTPINFNARNIGELVNSPMTEYVNAITVTGEKLFFTRRIEANQKRNQEDLFVFDIANNSVSPLPFNTSQNEGAITVSADGTMYVYTACDRVSGIGGCDLYIRQYSRENGWSKEYNLGENVNSNKWESQACFSPDGKYLYFISNRPGGFGKEDIWRSKITKEGFMPSENLGNSINTNQIEMSPFLHPDNLTLYFSSDGHIGMGDDDLFVSRRVNAQQQWNIAENMGYPINTHHSENSLIVANDGRTAYYSSDISGFGKEDIFQFDLPENLQAEPLEELELKIITQQRGGEVVLKNVSFTSNSYELEETSFLELDKLIAYLKKNPNLQIEIQGHTDDVGDEIDNQFLSEKRAKVVFEYLKIKVINSLSYKGFGESTPLESNATEKGRIINRRTSFILVK